MQLGDLYWKEKDKETYFKMDVRKKWQHREDIGETSVLEKMQQLGERMIDYSFISTRIKYLSEYLIWLEKET